MTGWQLPCAVQVCGTEYAVNADFRDILEVISNLEDDNEPEYVRVYVALSLFYSRFSDIPRTAWNDAIRQMLIFVNCGREETLEGPLPPRLIDWEQDQPMIIADINKVAGQEIRALPFCHWWTFISWFNGIGEGPLSAVVGLRDKLRRGKKLEKWEREYYTAHKETVQLKRKYTNDEMAEQERLKKLLGE